MAGIVKARLVYEELTAAWRVSCPYNKDWLNDLHAKVPKEARNWDKDTKTWLIDPMLIDTVKGMCDKHFAGWVEHKPAAAAAPPAVETNEFYLDFLRLCPKDDLKELYRKAVKANHPDIGGQTANAAVLNAAWSRIKTALGIS